MPRLSTLCPYFWIGHCGAVKKNTSPVRMFLRVLTLRVGYCLESGRTLWGVIRATAMFNMDTLGPCVSSTNWQIS